jgi:hypothetical protein
MTLGPYWSMSIGATVGFLEGLALVGLGVGFGLVGLTVLLGVGFFVGLPVVGLRSLGAFVNAAVGIALWASGIHEI